MRRQVFVNGGLLVLALGTLGLVWATREAPTSSELAQRKNKLLSSFQAEDVTQLRLARGNARLEITRDGAEFRISQPWQERADIATVNQFLGAVELASWARVADGVPAAAAGLDGGALTLELRTGQKTQKIRIGGPAAAPSGARYVEVEHEGEKQLYVVTAGVAAELDLPFDKFREGRLLEYGKSELAKIELAWSKGSLALEQRDHGAFFVQSEGRWELANGDAVGAIVTALSRLASERLVEPETARAALGPDPLRVQLQLTDKGAAPLTLSFGTTCPQAPSEALLLREQAGKPARAGCIPTDVANALRLTSDDARLFGPFSARVDEVEELRITRGAQKLDLARKDQAFALRSHGNSDVALDAGNERISVILQTRGKPDSGDDFVPTAEAVIEVSGRDEASHREERVSIARPRQDGSVCLKRAADGVVLCVGAEAARAFEPDASLLRGLSVLSFAASDLLSFTVEARGMQERVVRRDDGSYDLQEPRGFSHDGALVANAVQTLGALQAGRWLAGVEAPHMGFSRPTLRVTITLRDGAAPRELVVGAATPGGYFARLNPDPGVFLLPSAAFADLSTPLIERTLCPFAESEIDLVEARGAKGKGVRVGGPLLAALTGLRAERTVHFGPALPSEGFGHPIVQLTFTSKASKSARVDVGACDTLDDAAVCYARLQGVDATFAISRRLVTELRDFIQQEPH